MKTGLMVGGFPGGMGGWVVWVRWAPHRFSGWYVTGTFAAVLPTFVLVSRMQLPQQYRVNGHFLNAASSSRRETMVGGTLGRSSALRVGLGVGGTVVYYESLRSSSLGHAITHRICVMRGCVIWVWWVSHRYLG